MEDIAIEIIEMVKSLSPEVWRIFVRQAYVSGISNIAWGFLLGILTVLDVKAMKFFREEIEEDENYIPVVILGGIIGLFLLVLTFVCLTDGITMVANPDYRAIELLLQSIR